MTSLAPAKPSFGTTPLGENIVRLKKSTVFTKQATINLKKVTERQFTFERKKITLDKRERVQADQKRKRKIRETNLERTDNKFLEKLKNNRITKFAGNIADKALAAFTSLMLGWLIDKLPAIIETIKTVIAKIKRLIEIGAEMIATIGKIVKGSIDVAGQAIKNIVSFDFTDSEGKLKEKIDLLSTNTDDLGKQWDEASAQFRNFLEDPEKVRKSLTKNLEGSEGTSGARTTSSGDLFDIIASGEGGYNSVNQGVAGDTPGGAKSVVGKDLTDMTVREVMAAQDAGQLFAVGKYQIIPKTMKGFVQNSPDPIDMDDKFNAATQEKFKQYVMDVKRPAVGRYIRGESNDRTEAAQELSREFASIGLAKAEAGRQRGESRYSGTGGNRASIAPEEIESALDRARSSRGTTPAPSAPTRTIQGAKPGRGVLTAQYGEKRGSKRHGGTDIAAPSGTALVAPTKGKIVDYGSLSETGAKRGDPKGWGNFLVFQDEKGLFHLYGHLLEGFKKSGNIQKGEVIAKVGSTGKSSGPHLHWELGSGWSGGRLTGKRDPLSVYGVQDPFTVSSPAAQTRTIGRTQRDQRQEKSTTVVVNESPKQSTGGGYDDSSGGTTTVDSSLNTLTYLQFSL